MKTDIIFKAIHVFNINMLSLSDTQALLQRIKLLEKEKVTLSRKQKQLEDYLSLSITRIEKLEFLIII
ncbi:hypothetical protein [uncultured Dokdonia sp.]|uniref:hypothetical protein n=1 Tax=uncultured Dokdonia sp. TaxID=575653 RepID=UPI002627135E|nr:hypothetical protein [uncultured Dokdonia sp.]